MSNGKSIDRLAEAYRTPLTVLGVALIALGLHSSAKTILRNTDNSNPKSTKSPASSDVEQLRFAISPLIGTTKSTPHTQLATSPSTISSLIQTTVPKQDSEPTLISVRVDHPDIPDIQQKRPSKPSPIRAHLTPPQSNKQAIKAPATQAPATTAVASANPTRTNPQGKPVGPKNPKPHK